MMRRNGNRPLEFSRIHTALAIREWAVTVSLAARPSVSGAPESTERRKDMRRITPLILVLVVMATAATFPLAASANHGGLHGGTPIVRAM